MPRNVRNFWIELNVDGKKERVATGPRSADGGFELTVYMRKAGDVSTAIDIRGYQDNGKLVLWARANGNASADPGHLLVETQR